METSFSGTFPPVMPGNYSINRSWIVQASNGSNWVQSNGSENYLNLNIRAHDAVFNPQTKTYSGMMARYTSNSANSSAALITNLFSLTDSAICAKAVSIWIYRDSAFNTERLDIRITSNNMVNGSVLLGHVYPKSTMTPVVSTGGWYKYTFAIPDTFKSATSQVIFNGISSSTGLSRIYIDDVSIEVNTSPPVVTLLNPYRAICPGGSTSFSVSATGLMTNYQWQVYNGSNWANITNTGIYSGAQTATLTLTSATTAVNNYRYRCVVSNTCTPPTVSYAAILSVATRPWYKDNDGDGWGSPYTSLMDCVQPAGYVQNNMDCNDSNYNKSKWNTVGVAGFSAGIVTYKDLAIDGSGTPYLVYTDKTNSNKATVKKYNGSAWVTVGSAGVSAGAAKYNQIAIDATGTVYVVYADSANNNKATVKKYNGTAWVTVGVAGLSAAGAEYTALAIDANGTPYVAYRDASHNYKATVMKYNGTVWVAVGTPGFSTGSLPSQQTYMGIAINKAGQPYVVYSEGQLSQNTKVVVGNQLVVKRYNGSSWETVGGSSLQNTPTNFASLAIDGSGAPYIAYLAQGGIGYGPNPFAIVKKFDNTSWKHVGSSHIDSLPAYNVAFADITIREPGTPYLYYGSGVKKHDGTNWVKIADKPDFYGIDDDKTASIVIDGTGIPYITGCTVNDQAMVQKLDVEDRKPVITVQPIPDTVCAGGNATYNVVANNTYRYQWQVSTNGGSTFTNISNNSVYSGVTKDSLKLTAPPTSYHNYKYRCVLTGTCVLKDTTAAVALVINALPAVTSQPANKNICSGTNTSFNIAAKGTNVKYRWKVNSGSGWGNVPNSGIYSGVTSNTLKLTGATVAYNGYKYRCQVSGTCTPAVNSNVATLTVNPAVVLTTPVMSPNPAVAGQALNTLFLGYGPSSVTLSSSASGGTPGYAYSWTPTSGLLSTTSASTPALPTVTTAYTLIVTDTKGCTDSASFLLKVVDARGANGKVIVCHNNISTSVNTNMVPTHLGHGDNLGPCGAQNKGETSNGGSAVDEEDNISLGKFTKLKVYPNPNNGKFVVELPEDVGGGMISVTDMSGRLIQKADLNRNVKLEIDLGGVANGVYMVQMLNNNIIYRAMVTVKN
ncbi:MAG: T9SS type A sorting domain-containing protein [Flavipsychrobacter sp.]|nr:T9SS type A sorting domain-containing protein [Flavipsychrobacter sp.]